MGTFTDAESMELEFNEIDKKLSFINQYMEDAHASLNSSYDVANAQYVTESVTDDLAAQSLCIAYTEAGNDFIEKVSKAFDKLIETMKDFSEKLKIKMKMKLTGATIDARVTKIAKKVKENPFIGKQKIDCVDTKSIPNLIDSKSKILQKFLLDISGYKDESWSGEKLDKITDDIINQLNESVTPIEHKYTINDIITLFSLSGMNDRIKKLEKNFDTSMKVLKDFNRLAKNATDPNYARAAQRVATQYAIIYKQCYSGVIDAYNKMLSDCETVVNSADKTSIDSKDQRKEELKK